MSVAWSPQPSKTQLSLLIHVLSNLKEKMHSSVMLTWKVMEALENNDLPWGGQTISVLF